MATVKVQVVKWGKGHAVRLPKVALEKAEMGEGNQLEIRVEKDALTLRDLDAHITPKNLPDEQDWG
jgi:antitoxin component of MazEF toxin-antitoxin module